MALAPAIFNLHLALDWDIISLTADTGVGHAAVATRTGECYEVDGHMSDKTVKDALLAQIRMEHAGWRALLAEIGEERMEQPGPMGDWTFKDLVAHLGGWREWTFRKLEAGPGGKPAPFWPSTLTDDDEINNWFYEQNRDRPLRDVLADYDASFGRLAVAIAALPDEDIATPGRFDWMEGRALADAQFFEHLHEEHEPSIRAWLARTHL